MAFATPGQGPTKGRPDLSMVTPHHPSATAISPATVTATPSSFGACSRSPSPAEPTLPSERQRPEQTLLYQFIETQYPGFAPTSKSKYKRFLASSCGNLMTSSIAVASITDSCG